MGVAASFLPLKPGDVVDIVAPASQCPGETFKGGLRQLREWGLVPRVPDVLFGTTPFVSNTQAERERQLLAVIVMLFKVYYWDRFRDNDDKFVLY